MPVRAEIEVGVGELMIMGGASELMEAQFTFNNDDFEPDVNYEIENGVGKLEVKQPPNSDLILRQRNKCRKPINNWDIKLNNETLLELDIEAGVGEADLNLASLALSKLDVEVNVGELAVDLGANNLLNSFELDMDIGELSVDLSDTTELSEFDLSIELGGIDVDFTGDLNRDLSAKINAGVGEISLILPSDIGVKVVVDSSIGPRNGKGWPRLC